ncbi:hypothetical protein PRIPAC_75693 [Pristionchus pacificus]|uniref:Protein kinase domain-containing protein n=1 Tax=Pristionchus pacificus TaxID=54126 RepID=A0A2A6CZV3_PRIPA|nr:hypothetical protein PRIPAC_75693 [Pristionchus pacificus]|eukprot:PDM83626.1 protein kinase [Pristionchus pacificus]
MSKPAATSPVLPLQPPSSGGTGTGTDKTGQGTTAKSTLADEKSMMQANVPPKKKDKVKTKRAILKAGNVISSPTHTYTVVKLLGSGGFGDVYLVEDDTSKARYALKTEFYGAAKTLFSRLKIEAHVLDKCTKAPAHSRRHFLTLKDKGTTSDFKFICMDVVGPSLDSVRKKYCDGEFSKGTALNVSKRSLQAIWDVHTLGFLHRDIKPANFSIGLGPEQEKCIFMLDFGIAREFKNPNGTLRKPRENIPFLGTPRFASRACHKKEEQSPKDDVEVWIFMVFDLFDVVSGIPWKGDSDRPTILKKKDEMMLGKKLPTKKCPKEFLRVVTYIGKLEYVDTPDYAWMISVCEHMAKQLKVDIGDNAVDWADKLNAPPKNAGGNEKNDSDKQTGSDEDEEEGRTGGIFKLFGKGRKKQSTPNKKPKSNGSNHDTAEEIKNNTSLTPLTSTFSIMASPASTIAHLLDGLQHPHMVQSTLMQLHELGVTENILKSTGAREKVVRFTTDSFFGPLARSILNEWEDQIKEFSPPYSPSPSSMDCESQINELLLKLSDSSEIKSALKSMGELEVTCDLLIKTQARKKIEQAIFSHKLVNTSMGRRACRILAQWSEEFPEFAILSNRSVSHAATEMNERKRRNSDDSSSIDIKKSCPDTHAENFEDMFKSRKSHTKLYAGRSKESTMVLRPSSNSNQKTSPPSQICEAAKLDEIKKKIALRMTQSKEGKRKILQVFAPLSVRNPRGSRY